MTDPTQAHILERLDLIARVLALQVAADKSLTERARLLKMAGMDNRTIAKVLNTSDATIRTLTSNLSARRGKVGTPRKGGRRR